MFYIMHIKCLNKKSYKCVPYIIDNLFLNKVIPNEYFKMDVYFLQ